MTVSETELTLDLGAETIHCHAEELAHAVAGSLREMRTAAPFVTADDRATLRFIMAHDSGSLTVGDVFPDFDRDSHVLKGLRRLRTAQFIRPLERDRWEADEHIEIKPFARLIWDRLGEAAIFGDAPEPDVSEDIDLSPPEVNEPDDVVTTLLPKSKPGCDEADVLEFLNDDSSPTLKGHAG